MKRSFLGMLLCLLLPAVLLFGDAGMIPPQDWEASGYQYNMTYYAQVLRPDGTAVEADDSILAVFDAEGECRGTMTPIEGPNGRLFQMSIASNHTAESGLFFKVLYTESGEIFPIVETVDFVNDAIVPEDGIINPMKLHVRRYFFKNNVMVRWSDRPAEARLDMGMDDAVAGEYSPVKDVPAKADAWIVGTKGDGGEIALSTTVSKRAEVVSWQLAIKVPAGKSAVVSWNGWNVAGYEAYFFGDANSAQVLAMSGTDEWKFTNNTDAECIYTAEIVLAKAGYYTQLEFESGWNLFSLPFEITEAESGAVLKKSVFTVNNNAYSKATTIAANTGYWMYCEKTVSFAFVNRKPEAAPAPESAWTLQGTGANESAVPAGTEAFHWEKNAFTPTQKLISGKGYFIRKVNK